MINFMLGVIVSAAFSVAYHYYCEFNLLKQQLIDKELEERSAENV